MCKIFTYCVYNLAGTGKYNQSSKRQLPVQSHDRFSLRVIAYYPEGVAMVTNLDVLFPSNALSVAFPEDLWQESRARTRETDPSKPCGVQGGVRVSFWHSVINDSLHKAVRSHSKLHVSVYFTRTISL